MGRKKTAGYLVFEQAYGPCDLCDYGDGDGDVLCHCSTAHVFPSRKLAQAAIDGTLKRADRKGVHWDSLRIVRLLSAD